MNYDFSKLPTDLVLNILNIVVLFLIVRFLVYKPVKNFMDKRAARVCEAAKVAEEKSAAADELARSLQAKLDDAQNEADVIRNKAVSDAKIQADAIIGEAKKQSEKIISDAEKTAEEQKKEIISSLKNDIAESAEAIAERILERKVSDEDTKRIAEEFFRSQG